MKTRRLLELIEEAELSIPFLSEQLGYTEPYFRRLLREDEVDFMTDVLCTFIAILSVRLGREPEEVLRDVMREDFEELDRHYLQMD